MQFQSRFKTPNNSIHSRYLFVRTCVVTVQSQLLYVEPWHPHQWFNPNRE